MSKRIQIDPITRIEGHLRIDVEVDQGQVQNAWSSGQMWRGIETILKGRDPRDAWLFAQRICGVCTTVHAIASVRACEDAIGLEIPKNAQYIRNLILLAHGLHDHIVHFYHLSALDWVDIVSALKADPAKAANLAQSLSDWHLNSRQEFAAVQARVKKFVDSGQLGVFANGYWGHPAMKLEPEVNLLALAHYFQAMDYQLKANQVVAIFGSKTPNIQNLAVGGVANPINLDNQSALNMQKLFQAKTLLEEVIGFVQNAYLPDVAAIGAMYADWFGHGRGVTNYLATPDLPLDSKATKFDLPGGTIMNGDLATLRPIERFDDPYFRDHVQECITHAWYEGDTQRHPWKGETNPKYTEFQDDGKYSWVKAPRFQDKPMQLGPLDLATKDTWIWDYEDRTPTAPEGPTIIPTSNIPSDTPPPARVPSRPLDPVAPGIGDLEAPLISIPSGDYSITHYPMQVSLTDPNPTGAARLVYSINFGDWRDYGGESFSAVPNSVIRAQAIPIDPREWGSSGFNTARYSALPHRLDSPAILPSAPVFDSQTSVVSVALQNPNLPEISRLEYRIGDGGWTEYAGAFEIGAAGFPSGAGIEARAAAIAEYYQDSNPSSAQIGNTPAGLVISGVSHGLYHNARGERRMVTNLSGGRSGRFFEWGDPVPLPKDAARNDNIDKAVQQAIEDLENAIATAEAELAVLGAETPPNAIRIHELNRQIDDWDAELVALRTGEGGPGSNGNWASSMVVSGTDFSDVTVGERFRLGVISYYNGTIYNRTGANSVVGF